MSCVKFLSYFPPVFVVILFLWLFLTYVVAFCIFYLENKTKKFCYLVFIIVFAIMFVWSYVKSIFTDHDDAPYKYKVPLVSSDNTIKYTEEQIASILGNAIRQRNLQIFTRTEYGKVRYCRFCRQIKPDRAHHCSTCEKCILKMDHHCPWIFNCVGYYNQKQFILMLLYATVLCLIFVGTVAEFLGDIFDFGSANHHENHKNEEKHEDDKENDDIYPNLTKILIALGWAGALIFGSMIAILFFYNLANVFKNLTTLENMRETIFVDDGYNFSMGCCDNFLEVFGGNAILWLLPIQTARGNGHEFPVDFTLE